MQIDLLEVDVEAVPGALGDDVLAVRPELGPEPGHRDLQCGLGMVGKLVAPERLEDLRPVHRPRRVQYQEGQQRSAFVGTADRDLGRDADFPDIAEHPKQHSLAPKASPPANGAVTGAIVITAKSAINGQKSAPKAT